MKPARPPTLDWNRDTARKLALAAGLGVAATLSTCSPRESLLTRVEALKVLRVATLNSPTTYYVGAAGPTGFEYDLTRSFAHDLGVDVEVVVADSPSEILDLVRSGRAHLGAGLSVTVSREKLVRFTPPLRNVAPQMVYRKGQPKPKNLYDLDGRLRVPGDSAAAEVLKGLAAINPQLRWEETAEFGAEQVLFQVANAEVDYTIAPSDLVAINQRYYPQLRVAFALTDSEQIAWAFAPGDNTLYDAALNFIEGLDRKKLFTVLDRHFGHVSRVGTYGALALATHTQTRLPRYRKSFEDAATRFGMDWRMLASVGYQESLWDPAAVSPTGVRGLMQITTDTADFLNIENRLDPKQSIHGAARYLQQLRARLPPEIPEPDRTWMTLAAYNVGMGHLLDACVLTQQQGGDPTRWVDVRNTLPLLTQSKWHRNTRYGYARGHEAVTYVGNIRTYYDMLSWITGGPTLAQPQTADKPPEKKRQEEPLNINSPIL
jgi:membrane-bound lytic murein transglycosylase F